MSNVVEVTIKGTDKISDTMSKVSASLSKLAGIATAIGATLATAFTLTLKSIIKVGSKVENLKIRLNALLGSVREGNKAFDEMAKFASTVPFSFDSIMESATALAGVVKGGTDEISKMMPIIADLATVSGLSIQDTTSQVQRMMSAGAASADMFRERGILAMLGFEAGVSVSADETKRRLIEAFESPTSKFRDASKKMATTWDGVMSMIGDKWFTFKSNVADAGIFNFIKAIAITIDKYLGGALKASGDTAKSFSDFMIGTLRNLIGAVGFFADAFHGLKAVWIGLQVIFASFAEGMYQQILKVADGIRDIANMIPGVNIGRFETLEAILGSANERTNELKESFKGVLESEMPSEKVKEFAGEVERTYLSLQELSNATVEGIKAPMETLSEFQLAFNEQQSVFVEELGNSYKTLAESFFDLMNNVIDGISAGMATAIVEGGSMLKVFQNIGKMILTQLLTMFIKLGIQRLVLSAFNKTAVATEGSAEMAKASAATYGNAFASTAAIPIVGPALAPGVAAAASAAMLAGAGAASAAGSALGATVGARQLGGPVQAGASYLVGERGPELFTPNAGGNITPNNQITEGNGGVVIEGDIVFHIMENVTNAEALLEMDDKDLKEFVAEKFIPAMDALRSRGITPKED